MRLVEEERRRWAASYEEKTVMIEQLQRELASTVEALHVERSFDGESNSFLNGKTVAQNDHKTDRLSRQSPHHMQVENGERGYQQTHTSTRMSDTSIDKEYSRKFQEIVSENEGLKLQLSSQKKIEDSLKHRLEQQTIELEHTKNAWRDSEGKLQFRNNQVSFLCND